jgi:hypothetical protein
VHVPKSEWVTIVKRTIRLSSGRVWTNSWLAGLAVTTGGGGTAMEGKGAPGWIKKRM